jgi:hypothetical protein
MSEHETQADETTQDPTQDSAALTPNEPEEPEYTIVDTTDERPPVPSGRAFGGGGKTLDEAEQLVQHRVLIRQALGVFHKAAETCRKHEETIGNDTGQTDIKLAQCDLLIDLLSEQTDLGLAGTPIGRALAVDAAASATRPTNGNADDDEVDDEVDEVEPKRRGRGKGKGKAKHGAKRGRTRGAR